MRYIRGIGIFISAMILAFSAMAISANAQTVVVRRPIIVRHVFADPFYRQAYWNPYWNDPFYWEARQRYYDQQDARDAKKKLDKDRAKYDSGYMTAKDQEKLMKDQEKYSKAVAKLQRDRAY
jgi:hypothetical protein